MWMNAAMAAFVAAFALLLGEPPVGPKPTPALPPQVRRDEDPDVRALLAFIREACDPAAPKVGYMPDAATLWRNQHGEALRGIRFAPLAGQPWGVTAIQSRDNGPARIYLFVFDWHASGKVVVYGLTGGVRKAYLFTDPKQSALPVSRLNNTLVISGPARAPDPLVSVVVLETAEKLETADMTVPAADDGSLLLHARDAVIHGQTVRYEPEPHKNTVGYWTDARDWVSWDFEVGKPGTYRVEILQGCGKGSGGSKVDFAVAGEVLNVTVQDTGGFQNFVTRDIGRARFDKAGRYQLTVTPKRKPGLAVMDLRQVTLTPVKD
jgi:hypothetical protein